MDCPTARDALLTADTADLRHGPLAEHLAACPECALRAGRILAATRRLAADLQTDPAADVPGIVPVRAAGPRNPPDARPRRRLLRPLAGLAAAAAIALVLVSRDRAPVPAPTPNATAPAPGVTVPDGRNAVVFRTSDPSITVVWYY